MSQSAVPKTRLRRRRLAIWAAPALAVVAAAGLAGAPAQAVDSAPGITQVKLTYPGDPSTSIAISWREPSTAGAASVQLLRDSGDFSQCTTGGRACQVLTGTKALIGSADGAPYAYFQAVSTSLRPGTRYRYRVVDGSTVSREFSFTTPARASGSLRAAFAGEVHVGDEVQPGWPTPALAPTLQQIQRSGAQFVVSTGDNVNTGANEADWERLFATNPEAFGSVPFMTAVGNHETYGGFSRGTPQPQYFAAFPQPGNGDGSGRYYSFTVNGVYVAAVEANPETPRAFFDQEMRWLSKDLADAAKRTRFQVVVLHSPPFHSRTSRVTPAYQNPEFRDQLVPLMDRYGVEMVISGHDKHYVRSKPLVGRQVAGATPAIQPQPVSSGRGTTYMELTSTGQNYADFLPQSWMAKAVPLTAAYLQLDFRQNTIRATAIRPDGSVLDRFTVPQVR